MSVIYLKHPKHGEKVATLEAEARADEEKGWQRFIPVAPSPNPIAVQLSSVVSINDAPKKRGRPRKP